SYRVLGTDGFGRSDSRSKLRHFFEVNRCFVAIAALKALADQGDVKPKTWPTRSRNMASTLRRQTPRPYESSRRTGYRGFQGSRSHRGFDQARRRSALA